MADADDQQLTTFWAERWRYARDKTGQRLIPAAKAFFSNWAALTLTLAAGAVIFGSVYVLAEMQTYIAGVVAISAIFACALLFWFLTFAFNYLSAPAVMWRRDQALIAQLRSSLTPALRLSFTAKDCIKDLRRGSLVEAVSGQRWYDIHGVDRHILIQCTNVSRVRVDGIVAHVVALEVPQGAGPGPGFFEPIQITPPSRSEPVGIIGLPPGGSRFFSVLVQPTIYSMPRINGQSHPLDYEFLFDRSGEYRVRIEAHGYGTTVASIVLDLKLEKRDALDANKTRYAEYHILSVSERPTRTV